MPNFFVVVVLGGGGSVGVGGDGSVGVIGVGVGVGVGVVGVVDSKHLAFRRSPTHLSGSSSMLA